MRKALIHTLLTVGCVLLLCVGGCASNSAAMTVRTVDGCMVEISGIGTEYAKEISKNWSFQDDCKLSIVTEAGEGAVETNE